MAIPDAISPVPEPLPSDQQREIKAPQDDWSDKYALAIVRSDWAYAESYRINAHDWRYRNADELYLGWAPQDYWEGTRVPRSSLGVYVTFEQVQALLAKAVPSSTGTDNFHFSAKGQSNTQKDLAVTAWREMVLTQLQETRFRQNVKRSIHSMLQLGNGVLEVGMEDHEEEYVSFDSSYRPKRMAQTWHPVLGQMNSIIDTEQVFKRKVQREVKVRPYVRYVSVKDLYVDPNLESPDIQDAGYVIKRIYMRAGDVKKLGKSKDFKIPDDTYLTQLSMSKSTANQDVTKLSAELFRYNMWNPALDYTSDPMQKRIAVVYYTTPYRKIIWLQSGQGEESVIYNQPNRYGIINYFSCTYADVLDRWHALSISDVVEGEHRLQKNIINRRIDELALAIHRPMMKRRGVTVPWYQLKVSPGRVTEVENPKEDIVQSEVMNITQQAFVEVNASDLRVQRTTGMSDLAGLGTASGGGNSANRTATGVNTQAGATQDRVGFILDNIEDDLVERVVNAVIKFDKKFMDVKHAANWLKLDSRFSQLDPLQVMNLQVSCDCRASSKLRAKAQFMQTFPQIVQTLLNPEFLQLAGQTNNEVLDTRAIMDSIWDSLNYSPRQPWFKPMSQEQMQAKQQPPPEIQAKMAMLQQQIESDQTLEGRRSQTKLLSDILKSAFPHHAQLSELDDKFYLAHLSEAAESARADADRRTAAADRASGENGSSD